MFTNTALISLLHPLQGMRRNFVSYRHGPIDTLGEPYDFLSIMHYDNKAFTKNGRDTLQSLTNPKMKLGQIKRLTKTDVNQINKLYHCNGRDERRTIGIKQCYYYKYEYVYEYMRSFLIL